MANFLNTFTQYKSYILWLCCQIDKSCDVKHEFHYIIVSYNGQIQTNAIYELTPKPHLHVGHLCSIILIIRKVAMSTRAERHSVLFVVVYKNGIVHRVVERPSGSVEPNRGAPIRVISDEMRDGIRHVFRVTHK